MEVKDIRKLSEKQISALTCNSLAKICRDLAEASEEQKYKEEFLKKAKVFDELSEIHLINDKLEVEKWRKKLIGKNES